MTHQRQSLFRIAAIASCCAALFACGGGGGGGTTPVTTTTFTAACPGGATKTSTVSQADADAQCASAASIVTSVPASTYAAGSEELAAYTLLNAERARCGFGLLAQNGQLDTSARASADWLQINNYNGHIQVAGTPGFTGVTNRDRNAAAGYTSSNAWESWADVSGTNARAGEGQRGVRGLLIAPYHMPAMLSDAKDVGVSIRSATDSSSTNGPRVITMVELAYKDADGPQVLESQAVVTFPCDGSTGVQPSLTGEDPNPVPGRNLATSPLGSSIYIAVRRNNTLVITSASLTKVSTGTPVALRATVGYGNDPYGQYRSHEAYIAPDAPLSPNSSYQATLTGTNNGVAFSRTFTFTTGT
jgi:uncharacterized protein YkwD